MSEKQTNISHEEGPPSNSPLEVTKSVDTFHNDEALKVIVAYNGEREWTSAEENKLRRKIDWRLMPVLCITYALQYYDKAMLGQAVCCYLYNQIYDANITLRRFLDSGQT
jgi:hypothetical protein